MFDELCLPNDLPCPVPLAGAVSSGAFGAMEEGCLCPDEEGVRSLTEEHAQQMVSLLADLMHLDWCRKYSLDPHTGKRSSPNVASRLAERVEEEINSLRDDYDSCLAVYADAFGCEASESLDAAVRKFVVARVPKDAPLIQGELFSW